MLSQDTIALEAPSLANEHTFGPAIALRTADPGAVIVQGLDVEWPDDAPTMGRPGGVTVRPRAVRPPMHRAYATRQMAVARQWTTADTLRVSGVLAGALFAGMAAGIITFYALVF